MEVAIIVPVVLFISTVVMVVFIRKFTNDERMAMIEKGVDVKSFRFSNTFTPLRYGLLLIGAGTGLLLATIISASVPRMDEDATYFSLILICSGLGLFASYQMEQRKRKELED